MEKTLEIQLAEQRERIAKAIETGSYVVPKTGNQLKEALLQAAWIARNTE